MYSIPLEIRNNLVKKLAYQEYWLTFNGRIDVLKRAGLTALIPHVNLEGKPSIVASQVINLVQEYGKNAVERFIQTLADLENDPELVKPSIVCLCGSTRFSKAFQEANFNETLAGKIVLTIGCDMKSDNELFHDKSPDELTAIKNKLDKLHLQKILLADEILILNVNGYIGESTRKEILFAEKHGKKIRYLES
jgi:hypothetical protein